ncbi:hypothetical protein MBLNU459_g6233t1 [Dothideomycetes sp. NU459]
MPAALKRPIPDDGSVSPPPTKRKVQETKTSASVANFFKPTSSKDPEKTSWRTHDNSLLVCTYRKAQEFARDGPRKIAAFDFDSTLITPASGKKFASDGNDWKWWHGSIPNKLRKLVADGYLVVVISNQGGISMDSNSKSIKSNKKRLSDFKQKVTAVMNQLDLPISLYAATGKDKYRKPRIGMWETLLHDQDLHDPGAVDLEACYFVGDAGGRTGSKTGSIKPDFSCSDRDMASNAGIKFYTPEEFFLGEQPRPFARTFDPAAYLNTVLSAENSTGDTAFVKKGKLDLVLFCGSPGSGKSTFFWDHLKPLGYERVNQDILKTRDRCIQAATVFLEQGKSVAVDNTNADPETRAHWIKVAAKFGIRVRCVLFTAPSKLCEHNDTVRALGGPLMNPEERIMLPKMAFTGFASRYREPTLKEGLQDIVKVDFQFWGSEEQKSIWKRFWI